MAPLKQPTTTKETAETTTALKLMTETTTILMVLKAVAKGGFRRDSGGDSSGILDNGDTFAVVTKATAGMRATMTALTALKTAMNDMATMTLRRPRRRWHN